MDTRYSLPEYERRFLLDGVPSAATDPRTITDRYLIGSRLRLRAVDDPDAAFRVVKLGHKRRLAEDDPRMIWHTSLFLDESEYGLLATLPARLLVKTRWTMTVDGHPAAVDVHSGVREGLVVLEVDFGDVESMAAFEAPSWVGPEVTDDHRFTGGGLADLDRAGLDEALADHRHVRLDE